MGFLDIFKPQPTTPTVPSVLPDAAKQQILCGQLPVLAPNNLFLKNGETCHYADRAIYEKRTVNKKRIRKNTGYSMPGLFKGTRVNMLIMLHIPRLKAFFTSQPNDLSLLPVLMDLTVRRKIS